MSLYSKKLHIKKPNGVIQTANLYTDKNDVGSNYLTFRYGGNTIYSILDVNGDVDCKINKNNINYKIKKENIVNVVATNKLLTAPFSFTVPDGVTVLKIKGDYYSKSGKWERYIKVIPNRIYNFNWYSVFNHKTEADGNDTCGIQIFDTVTKKILTIIYYEFDGHGVYSQEGAYYFETELHNSDSALVYFEYSSEINKTTTIHADLT